MTDKELAIGFIGGGNMARAMVSGLLKSGHNPATLYVSDPSDSQREIIQKWSSELHLSRGNADAAEHADVLVLAVKPQVAAAVLDDLKKFRRPESQLVMSVMAGVTLHSLESALSPTATIVRVMPNQPALAGAGIAVMVATGSTGSAHREQAHYVASATGQAVWISDEKLMDAVTAISGSGPAYFYLLMEIMENCAVEMGLPEALARVLARETGLGAGRVAVESALELKQIRESVTSKGGTTAAALDVLEKSKIRDIVTKALVAARDRSVELGISSYTAERDDGDNPLSKNE